jgi:hypothetical protein
MALLSFAGTNRMRRTAEPGDFYGEFSYSYIRLQEDNFLRIPAHQTQSRATMRACLSTTINHLSVMGYASAKITLRNRRSHPGNPW